VLALFTAAIGYLCLKSEKVRKNIKTFHSPSIVPQYGYANLNIHYRGSMSEAAVSYGRWTELDPESRTSVIKIEIYETASEVDMPAALVEAVLRCYLKLSK
jgi:hypothetical protein